MKKVIFFALFCAISYANTFGQCNTLPQTCADACYLGTLPASAQCGTDDDSIHLGTVVSFNLSNIGAIAGDPSTIITGCAYPGADVWYSFTATGNQLSITLISDSAHPLHSPNINLYSGNSCSSLLPVTCFTGTGGTLSTTFSPIEIGGTYYLQISGGSLTDQGNFTLQLSNNTDCSKCVLGEFITAMPPPVNGTYAAGQTVNFCFTVSNWNQNASNWLHGVIPTFGPGWDVSTFTATSVPLSCDTTRGAHWGFYQSVTSDNSGLTWGPGFFYETSLGSPNDTVDDNPGDNYGDPGINGGNCQVTFCWKITARSGGGANSSSLSVQIMTTGDSQSGSWTSPGCESDPETTFNATVSSCLPPVISTRNASCRMQNGVAIAAGQGTGPWNYLWADALGDTLASLIGKNAADSILNLAPGQYFVTVTDANNCSNESVATIEGLRDSFNVSIDSVSCFNVISPDGSIALTPLVIQNEPYTYSLNGGPFQNAGLFNHLSAGIYKVVAKNIFGCLDTLSASISLPAPILLGNPVITSSSCQTQGSISVPSSGGTGTLNYNWSNGHTGNPQTNLAAGTYRLTVTDQRACTDTASYTITPSLNAISFSNPSITNVSCFNGSNGSITARATGGKGTITYHWNYNNASGTTITSLAANVYSVTATDSVGCTATTSYPVGSPPAIVIGPATITPVLCGISGTIHLVATGGTGNLSYMWSPLHTGDSITGLSAGNYKLTVTDNNLCTVSATYTVGVAPNTFTFGNPVLKNISCYGKLDGSVTATTVGGAAPIRYQWNTGLNDTTATITGLPVGENYTVTATDASGCTASATYAIVGPLAITLGSADITTASCQSGGSIAVPGYGGSGLLTFTWSNTAQTGDSIVNLTGGTYYLTVTDQNACSITAVYNVGTTNGGVSLNTPVIVNEKCYGTQNGSISVTASGGTGSITYAWSNGDSTTTITNLSASTYMITATDSLGCSASATYSITQPSAITPGIPSTAGSSCNNTGYIALTTSGGTGPLSYSWSNNESGDSIGALAASNYFLTITDQNGCSLSATYNVPLLPNGIAFANPLITPVSCNGGSDGSITASASGGSGTLHYNWGGNHTGATLTDLASGPYSVTVTDGGNCSASITYIVYQPAALNPNLKFRNSICYGESNDTVTANPTGGNAGYFYLWSNQDSTATVILGAGPFSVTVTDTKNCSATASGTISQDPQIFNTNILTLHLCDNPAHGDLQLDGTGGTGQLTYTVIGIGTDTNGYFPGLTSGTYTFTITDTAGCSQNPAGTVTIPNSIATDSFAVTADSATCYGFNNGQIIITPQNQDGGPFVYQLDGGSFLFSDTFTGVSAGTHSIVIKSFVFGCPRTYTVNIGQPVQYTVSINPDTVISNPGQLDTVSVVTDFPNPVYTWSPVTMINCTNCNPAIITADTVNTQYSVKVYSSPDSSCYSIDSVIIIVNPPVLPDSFIMPSAFTPNGDGRNDEFGPIISANYTSPTIKTFRIYNRWGQLVHNADVYWDGRFDGKDQPVGTYVYYIEVDYPNRENTGNSTFKKEGSVTLLR